jgi:hypothetical protein
MRAPCQKSFIRCSLLSFVLRIHPGILRFVAERDQHLTPAIRILVSHDLLRSQFLKTRKLLAQQSAAHPQRVRGVVGGMEVHGRKRGARKCLLAHLGCFEQFGFCFLKGAAQACNLRQNASERLLFSLGGKLPHAQHRGQCEPVSHPSAWQCEQSLHCFPLRTHLARALL